MRYLFFIILLFFAATSPGQIIMSHTGTVAPYCSSCSPGDPTDLMCEDAEGSNTIETGATDFTTAQCSDYTASIDTGATLFEASHSGTLSCSNKGDNAIQIYCVNSAGGADGVTLIKDVTDSNNSYASFYFNIVSEELDNGDVFGLMYYCNTDACDTNFNAGVSVKQNASGNLILNMKHRLADNSTEENEGSTTLSTGTWYRVELAWLSGTSATVYLNGSSEISDLDCRTDQTKAIGIGSDPVSWLSAISNDPITVQMDIIGADDDTRVGACE